MPAFVQAHTLPPPVSVRLNPGKMPLPQAGWQADKIPWSSHGYYLQERPLFTTDPLFHAGAYYVQEASSMFLEQALRQSCNLTQPLKLLDLCAAPGGKSTLLQSLISDDSLLLSNEVIKPRANILAENITKWGASNVVVTNNDPKDFERLPEFFDCIVIDAPCSGSGLFRKDAAAMDEWTEGSVAMCSKRQQRIITDVIGSLKPGAVLIYSTCSYSAEEDEDIADWLLETYPVKSLPLQTDPAWNIVETHSPKHSAAGYRFFPDRLKGEGFFLAVFKKEGESDLEKQSFKKIKETVSAAEQQLLSTYLRPGADVIFHKWQEDILAFPTAVYPHFLPLQKSLYIKKAGVNMGQLIRAELLPSHEWALYTDAAAALPLIDLSLDLALDYLRKKDISLPAQPSGWAVVQYQKISLGLVKILPSRINNYYPKAWRILNK